MYATAANESNKSGPRRALCNGSLSGRSKTKHAARPFQERFRGSGLVQCFEGHKNTMGKGTGSTRTSQPRSRRLQSCAVITQHRSHALLGALLGASVLVAQNMSPLV